MAGVAVVVAFDGAGCVSEAGLAGLGVGGTAIRLAGAEAAIVGRALTEEAIGAASVAASAEVQPMTDVHADEGYRRHLVAVLLRPERGPVLEAECALREAPAEGARVGVAFAAEDVVVLDR